MGFQRKGGGKWVGSGRGRGQGDGVKKNWSGGGRGTPNDSLSGKDRIRKTGRSKVWRTAEDALEAKFGFDVFAEGEPRLGWLLNMAAVCLNFCIQPDCALP